MPRSPRVDNDFKAERERLASDLHRLEEALSDAREGAPAEEEGSLVARLREATRKRVRIEEEFERSSDRWRDERRTLNAEIDRLDRALQKAQGDARRGRGGAAAPDPQLASRLKEAAEQREQAESLLEEERRARLEEREKLASRMADLEARLVDTLERANNAAHPDTTHAAALRAEVEAEREKITAELRSELEAPLGESRKAIQALEEERGRLHLEIHRLKEQSALAASGTPDTAEKGGRSSRLSFRERLKGLQRGSENAPTDAGATEALEARIASLTEELRQEQTTAGEATSRAEAARARVEEMESRVADLERKLDDARSAALPDSALTARLEASEQARTELEARLDAHASATGPETDSDAAERIRSLGEAAAEARAELAEVLASREALSDRLRIAEEAVGEAGELEAKTAAWEGERQTFEARIADLEADLLQNREARTRAEAEREELDGRLRAAGEDAAEGASERQTLEARIGQLEAEVAQAREAGAAREALVRQVQDLEAVAAREATEAEARSQTWNQERESLTGRVSELEHALESATAQQNDVDARCLELETAFEDARKHGNALQAQLEVETADWKKERIALDTEIETLQANVRAAREADASADESARKVVADLEVSERKLAAETRARAEEKKGLEGRIRELEQKLGESLGAAEREREQLEAGMASLEKERTAEVGRLAAEIETARHEREALGQEAAAQQAAWAQEREALGREAAAQQAVWAQEREGLETAIAELRGEIAGLVGKAAKKRGKGAGESAASRGIASFGRVLSSLGGGPGDLPAGTSVADLEARRQTLELRLLESEDSRNELASKLESANKEWEKERRLLEKQLDDMPPQGVATHEQAELEERQKELLVRLQEAEERYTALEKASMASARAWDQQRGELEGEISQWEQQVTAEAERIAERTRQALSEKYEKQLRELQTQKEELEAQFAARGKNGGGAAPDPAMIASEMARVDSEIDEINQLIEDPNAALSNVMRKNAERSELQAYRRGLSYLAERVTPDKRS